MKEKIKSLMRQLIESEERAQAAELHSSELALQLSAIPNNKPPPPSGAPPDVVAALHAQIADLRAQNDSLQNASRSTPNHPDLSADLAAEQRLRADADNARSAAERRLTAAEQRATAAEQKVHSLEQRLAGADQRAAAGAGNDAKLAAAEQRASSAEQRLAAAEQRASSAEQRASSAEQRLAAADQRAASAEQRATAADQRATAAEKRAAAAPVHDVVASPPLAASPRAVAPTPAARRGPPPATPTRATPPTAPPRHVTASGDDTVSPRQPPPPSPPASDDIASPREQPPPPSDAPDAEAESAAPPMRGPPPIQPRAPPSGGGPPSSAPPSRPPPSAPQPGNSMTMRRGPPPAVPNGGAGGEFSSMTMPRQRSTTDTPALAPATRSSAPLSPGGGPPPVVPRKGSGAAMLGSSAAIQSVPVRRDIPPVESAKGGKNDLQGGWAVVGDQNVAKKKYMEDAFVMLPDFMPNAAYFAVYDGHEGREAVDYVRVKLHEHLRDALNEGKTVFEAFEASYRRCDADLCALEVRKSGTTAVSVLIRKEGKNRVLYVANVGDSRATLCNKGKGERLSYDHKASDPAELKRVTDLGATVLWDKVQGQLSVTRALGDHDLKQYVVCEPHFATMTLAKEHKFLVVACDGIWDVTDDQTAVDVVEKAGKEPFAKAKRLIEYVIEKGTSDNLTAAFINLQV